MRKLLAKGLPALVLVIAAMSVGGLPWAGISLAGIYGFIAVGANWREVLLLMLPAMFWLAVSHFTGDRRIFFPFSMLFVASVALRPNWTLVMVILLLFLGVRILQDATFKVLGVELIVALAALCPIYFAQKTLPQLGQWRSALAVACSLLAFIGLIF